MNFTKLYLIKKSIIFDNFIPLTISLKIAAYLFYNFENFSIAANVGSFLVACLLLFFATLKSTRPLNIRRLGLVLVIFTISFLHALLNLSSTEATFYFVKAGLIAVPFLFLIEILSAQAVRKTFYYFGVLALTKILIDFIPMVLIWLGASISDPLPTFLLGNIDRGVLLESIGGQMRIFDASSVLFILSVFVISRWSYWAKIIVMFPILFVVFVNFTISLFSGIILVYLLYLIALRSYTVLFLITVILVISGSLFFQSETSNILFDEKEKSTSIKFAQIENTLLAFQDAPLGNGIGNIDEKLFRDGDLLIENSYLFLIYAYGIFSAIPIFFLVRFFCRSIRYSINNLKVFPAATTVILVLVSSGSNPYLFAGSIYVVFYAISKLFELSFRENSDSFS